MDELGINHNLNYKDLKGTLEFIIKSLNTNNSFKEKNIINTKENIIEKYFNDNNKKYNTISNSIYKKRISLSHERMKKGSSIIKKDEKTSNMVTTSNSFLFKNFNNSLENLLKIKTFNNILKNKLDLKNMKE